MLPQPIFRQDAIPRDYVRMHFENMFWSKPETEKLDKDKLIDILELLDVLIPIKHDASLRHEYFSIYQTIKHGIEYVVFDANPDKFKGFFSAIKHLVPRKINPPDFGFIEVSLLHQLSQKDLESIASSVGISVQECPEGFELFKQEPDSKMIIGRYINAVLELNVVSTHVHNSERGCIRIEDFSKIRDMFGEEKFYEFLGESWHTVDKLPILTREFLRQLSIYIKSRIPDIKAFTEFPFSTPCKHAESASIQSFVDILLLAKKSSKHLKGCFTENIDVAGYKVREAVLQDVAVSASSVRYFKPVDNESQGYVSISLIQRIKEKSLREILSKISGVGIRRLNNVLEFVDGEIILGRYSQGHNPSDEDDLSDKTDDVVEFSVSREIYFSNPEQECLEYINDKKYQQLVALCGSKEIFETAFSIWKPISFITLPAASKEIIKAIDYYIRQRSFKWLNKYNQGGAATGTMTLVRGR